MEHDVKKIEKEQKKWNNTPRKRGRARKVANLSTPPGGARCSRKKVSMDYWVKKINQVHWLTNSTCSEDYLFQPFHNDTSDEFDDNNVECLYCRRHSFSIGNEGWIQCTGRMWIVLESRTHHTNTHVNFFIKNYIFIRY